MESNENSEEVRSWLQVKYLQCAECIGYKEDSSDRNIRQADAKCKNDEVDQRDVAQGKSNLDHTASKSHNFYDRIVMSGTGTMMHKSRSIT